ncbi:MAG: ATP-grasp domain-containing protein [Ignavibacteriales bacterium]|nr:ATP-grasp domain-containing protein [Ignavibacteriales bacterium]
MNDDGGTIVASSVQEEATRTDTYAEWDTQATVNAVQSALEERHRVTLIEANEEAFQRFREVRPEIVFNIAEGFRGASRESQIPAMLEMLGIPYTGSNPVTLGICLDKSRAKEILSYYRIPTPPFSVISSLQDLAIAPVSFPGIVKPLHEGSSKGIFNASIVRTAAELQIEVERIVMEYDQPALVEKFLPGREFTVALLGNGNDVKVLPIAEIRFDALPPAVSPIYSYEAKWIWDQLDHPIDVHECPARIGDALRHKIESICKQAFRLLGCRDWCRIDVRLDENGEPNIIELNPLPGILPNPEEHSCFPQAARAAGISYNQMLNEVLNAAIVRYELT